MNDNRCVICGDDIPEGRQVCKICEEVNKEVSDEVEQAFRQGFIAGTKFEAAKEMAELTKDLVKGVTKAVTQTINAVDYDVVYSAFKAQETEEKHWNECRQISAYEAENKRLKSLLRKLVIDSEAMSRYCSGMNCDHCPFSRTTDRRGNQVCLWERLTETMELIGNPSFVGKE